MKLPTSPAPLRILMLIIVTIKAQQFPVTPVRRIVRVIVILMMHRKFAQRLPRKFPAASPAHMRKKRERLFAIALLAIIGITTRIGQNLRLPFRINISLRGTHGLGVTRCPSQQCQSSSQEIRQPAQDRNAYRARFSSMPAHRPAKMYQTDTLEDLS